MTGAASGMSIRPAVPEDAPVLARLNRRARAAAMPWLAEMRSEAEVAGWLRRYLIPRVRVLCAGGDLALGYIGFGEEGGGWFVHDLYIAPDAQGRGLGTALLRCAIEAAADAPLRLRCFTRNAAARGFYERRGFVVEAEDDGSGNEEGEPDVLDRRLTAACR